MDRGIGFFIVNGSYSKAIHAYNTNLASWFCIVLVPGFISSVCRQRDHHKPRELMEQLLPWGFTPSVDDDA